MSRSSERGRVFDPKRFDMDVDVLDLSATDKFGKKALDSVSLSIPQGSDIRITGLQGSGKTLLASAIAGEYADPMDLAYAGHVVYKMRGKADASRVQVTHLPTLVKGRNLSMVGQTVEFLKKNTARDEIMMGVTMNGIAIDRQKLDKQIGMLGLERHLDKLMTELSGGTRQRVSIAAALAPDPNMIVLDEPTSSLDQGSKQEVNDMLNGLVNEFGTSIVMVSHDPLWAPRQIQMRDGRIIADITE